MIDLLCVVRYEMPIYRKGRKSSRVCVVGYHILWDTRVPYRVVLVMLGYVPGRVVGYVPGILSGIRVPSLVVLVMLGYSGMYPVGLSGTRVRTRVSLRVYIGKYLY